ncbi:MAG: hypothetical protein AAB425_06715 [Bdellovibrionota bacterium]
MFGSSSRMAVNAVADYHNSMNEEMRAARRLATRERGYNQEMLSARPAPERTPTIRARAMSDDDQDAYSQNHTVTRFVF